MLRDHIPHLFVFGLSALRARTVGPHDYMHQKYPLGELWLQRWGDQASCKDIQCYKSRIDALEREAVNGRAGFLVFQDVKHLHFDVVHHAPKASSSFNQLHETFAAAQARFSAPSRKDFQGMSNPARRPARARCPKVMHVLLEKATKMSHKAFKNGKQLMAKQNIRGELSKPRNFCNSQMLP